VDVAAAVAAVGVEAVAVAGAAAAINRVIVIESIFSKSVRGFAPENALDPSMPCWNNSSKSIYL
jgi:hypothetical protein